MSERKSFADLTALMHRLRSPGGCPWDSEQTHETLRPYLIEEAYEVLDALDNGTDDDLREELGDVLLQVVFHAELGAERGAFDIADVIAGLHDKLVRRHPHVFADIDVEDAAEVKRNWAAIKAEERVEKARRRAARGHDVSTPPSVLDGVPRGLPALLRGHRIGQKAASIGLDWTDADDVRPKIAEELDEIAQARASGDQQAVSDEIGDLLLAVASYSRHLGVNAEFALRGAIDRFERRTHFIEAELRDQGLAGTKQDRDTIDEMWKQAKRRLADEG